MATDDPHGVITVQSDAGVDQLLRRAVTRIEAAGLVVFAVIDHSGEAADAGLTMPDTKLVLFGSPTTGSALMLAHPRIALDLPLKLLISEGDDGQVLVSYNDASYLARRYDLTDVEADALRVDETIAQATKTNP